MISVLYAGDDKPTVLESPQVTTPTQREKVAREILDFFTFRKGQPSYFEGPTGPNQWSWLEITPQHVFKNAAGETSRCRWVWRKMPLRGSWAF